MVLLTKLHLLALYFLTWENDCLALFFRRSPRFVLAVLPAVFRLGVCKGAIALMIN